ncbi:glycerophosphodiester phosphodiesterase family protein [Saccharothrix syringae]|uniref:glycerophosphodiester phosphodiesterase n=1 Tax=Saccharothrix syringae TaxID=103733 RepID=A0A5Q0H5J1_SACSY|nr:glycerophosphodiester phosphodiesterase family protein [Saccharothrix syringae]QFZ21204.1 glycerophosphodiester phosphodiesterase [Saccharothrix syringae]
MTRIATPARLAAAAVLLLQLGAVPPAAAHPGPEVAAGHGRPLVIGHRGASGYRPEHTAGAYELAARMGADYLEPDLVSTKDGVLVARHENEIGGSTDVAAHPEFASRRTTKVVDGWEMTGWFTEDFTLAELKTLRAREPRPSLRPGSAAYDGRYSVLTFQEVIALARRLSRELGRPIGLYPETKHPSYFAGLGLPLEPALVRTLNANGLNHRGARVFVQSFESDNLRWLDGRLRVPLVQLVWAPEQVTVEALAAMAGYADVVGVDQTMVIPWEEDGTLGKPTGLVRQAHRVGLAVHAYTFSAENELLPGAYRSSADGAGRGRMADLLEEYFEVGLDGAFTDHVDLGVTARRQARR